MELKVHKNEITLMQNGKLMIILNGIERIEH